MTTKRTARPRGSATARRRGSTTRYPARRRRSTASTIGAALGLLLVSTVLKMSWPMRLGLVGLVLVLGLAWILWSHRAEIRAAAGPDVPGGAAPADTPPDSTPDPIQNPQEPSS